MDYREKDRGVSNIAPCKVCPWWLGYLLASPLRKLLQNPKKVIEPYVCAGMTVVEIGPGMGFFTFELAKKVEAMGRVIAIDIQPQMLEKLKRRAITEGLHNRIETRLAKLDSMGMTDLAQSVDFVFAYAVVHEMLDSRGFFKEAYAALKAGGTLFIAEPGHHVSLEKFNAEIQEALAEGFQIVVQGRVGVGHKALLCKANEN